MSKNELPLNEWVVIFYPQTGTVRLCPTLDVAREMISVSSAAKHLYRSPGDFRQRHDHHTLEKFWQVARKNAEFYLPQTATGNVESHPETPPDTDTENFAKLLWGLLQDIGDRVRAPQQTQLTKEHYELKRAQMQELVDDEVAFKEKYNNQARKIFRALLESGKQFLLEDEIRRIILELVVRRELKTKQDPWVVFQYYRPQFIKDGFVLRGGSNYVKQTRPR